MIYICKIYYTNTITGNALAWVQWVHKPADLWDIIFAPTDFEASSTMCTR